jgi:hypothetical protein
MGNSSESERRRRLRHGSAPKLEPINRGAVQVAHCRWVPAILSLLGIVAGTRVLIVTGAGLSALSLNLAIFAILNGVALIEFAKGPSGEVGGRNWNQSRKDDSRSGQVP